MKQTEYLQLVQDHVNKALLQQRVLASPILGNDSTIPVREVSLTTPWCIILLCGPGGLMTKIPLFVDNPGLSILAKGSEEEKESNKEVVREELNDLKTVCPDLQRIVDLAVLSFSNIVPTYISSELGYISSGSRVDTNHHLGVAERVDETSLKEEQVEDSVDGTFPKDEYSVALSEEAYKRILEVISNPPPVSEAMKELYKKTESVEDKVYGPSCETLLDKLKERLSINEESCQKGNVYTLLNDKLEPEKDTLFLLERVKRNHSVELISVAKGYVLSVNKGVQRVNDMEVWRLGDLVEFG